MRMIDMRNALRERFPNGIRGKSIDSMSEAQIQAIYHSLVERKDAFIGKKRKIPKSKRLHEPIKYEQMKMEI